MIKQTGRTGRDPSRLPKAAELDDARVVAKRTPALAPAVLSRELM